MKKKILFCALGWLLALSAAAKPYSITLLGEYGYNTTWSHFGGVELRANLPFNEHFELDVAGELLSSHVYTFSATSRPKFPLSVGELFLDGTLFYSAVQRNRIADYVMAASVGYRMDYVSVQLGLFGQVFGDLDLNYHAMDGYVVDPFNVLYRVQGNVRPEESPWNVYLGVSDYTELEYERHWQPIFFLGGYYDLPIYNLFQKPNIIRGSSRSLRVLAEVYCKPTGMFHLDATFYGIKAKLGVCLRLDFVDCNCDKK